MLHHKSCGSLQLGARVNSLRAEADSFRAEADRQSERAAALASELESAKQLHHQAAARSQELSVELSEYQAETQRLTEFSAHSAAARVDDARLQHQLSEEQRLRADAVERIQSLVASIERQAEVHNEAMRVKDREVAEYRAELLVLQTELDRCERRIEQLTQHTNLSDHVVAKDSAVAAKELASLSDVVIAKDAALAAAELKCSQLLNALSAQQEELGAQLERKDYVILDLQRGMTELEEQRAQLWKQMVDSDLLNIYPQTGSEGPAWSSSKLALENQELQEQLILARSEIESMQKISEQNRQLTDELNEAKSAVSKLRNELRMLALGRLREEVGPVGPAADGPSAPKVPLPAPADRPQHCADRQGGGLDALDVGSAASSAGLQPPQRAFDPEFFKWVHVDDLLPSKGSASERQDVKEELFSTLQQHAASIKLVYRFYVSSTMHKADRPEMQISQAQLRALLKDTRCSIETVAQLGAIFEASRKGNRSEAPTLSLREFVEAVVRIANSELRKSKPADNVAQRVQVRIGRIMCCYGMFGFALKGTKCTFRSLSRFAAAFCQHAVHKCQALQRGLASAAHTRALRPCARCRYQEACPPSALYLRSQLRRSQQIAGAPRSHFAPIVHAVGVSGMDAAVEVFGDHAAAPNHWVEDTCCHARARLLALQL